MEDTWEQVLEENLAKVKDIDREIMKHERALKKLKSERREYTTIKRPFERAKHYFLHKTKSENVALPYGSQEWKAWESIRNLCLVILKSQHPGDNIKANYCKEEYIEKGNKLMTELTDCFIEKRGF